MTKKYLYSTCLSLIFMFFAISPSQLLAQTSETNVTGVVTESGTGQPLKQVSVSVSSTGVISETDENGAFSINVPNLQAEIIFNLPGYIIRNVYLNGREKVNVSLVLDSYRSLDDNYNTPKGLLSLKDASNPVATLTAREIQYSKVTSFDQTFSGKVPGLSVIQQSGMPGSRTYMNIRGISSIYGKTEPLLIIDGMIHDYNYADISLMEGFAMNPFDVLDVDDISDISVIKDGISYLGATGSNGLINVNTEQKSETSTVMKFSLYGGISLTPKNLDVMDAGQFNNYFVDMLHSQGYDDGQVNNMYPWLNGGPEANDYYKYNNNTDWQNEIYRPATVSKAHFFLKGGDEIATYNISTGYLSHKGIYENSNYSRYNLRVNGLINITDKFSIIPNAKLSVADSRVANHGADVWKNPVTSALLKPPTMASNARDGETGVELDYLDDVGDIFMVSNPKAIVRDAVGKNRNYHFLSSVTAQYKINEHLNLYTLLGLNFNNTRENIFLPDLGMVQVDSAYNSPGDFVYEFRSTQNHSKISYTTKTASGHNLDLTAGFRYLENKYKYNLSLDLNTPSDEFKSLGQGSQFSYLRTTTGDNRGLKWVDYYGNFDYNFRNKYYLNVNVSYDGNSAVNSDNRYNFYPSVSGAWRLSSESFLSEANWLSDLKLRASYSVTGNMYSTIYDYSKLYYTDRRLNSTGALIREVIPNKNLELEKRNSINAGLDMSLLHQVLNVHVDYFKANVNNLVIKQELPSSFGFTDYYDNGGKLEMSGIEASADLRLQFSSVVWRIGGSISNAATKVKSLDFINPDTKNIITSVEGAQFITSEGNAVNAFYGYKTDGIISGETGVIGPNGAQMQEGDVKFVDVNGDSFINEADKMIIGDPNPDFFGGLFTSVAIDKLEISAMFNYSVGNDIYNYVRSKTEGMDAYANQSISVLDRWTSGNPSTSMPRMSYGDPTGNTVFSDRWIEDGTYLRLGQLTVSYTLPRIQGFAKGLAVYLTATNLFTISNYSGYDPDFAYMNSPFYMGIDYGKMPQSKSFVLGLKIDL